MALNSIRGYIIKTAASTLFYLFYTQIFYPKEGEKFVHFIDKSILQYFVSCDGKENKLFSFVIKTRCNMIFGLLKRLRALPIVIVRLRHQIGLYFDLIVGVLSSLLAFWFYFRFWVVQVFGIYCCYSYIMKWFLNTLTIE